MCKSRKTPCDELQNLSANEGFKNHIAILRTQVHSTSEHGYSYQKAPVTGALSSAPMQSNAENPNILDMPTGGDYIGGDHHHPYSGDGWFQMFPVEDIGWLYKVAVRHHRPAGTYENYQQFFLTLTIPSDPRRTFVIKVKDITKFNAFIQKDSGKTYLEAESNLKFLYNSIAPDNHSVLIHTLLKLMNKYSMGIGLYEASADLNSWTELLFDPMHPNAVAPITKPCN